MASLKKFTCWHCADGFGFIHALHTNPQGAFSICSADQLQYLPATFPSKLPWKPGIRATWPCVWKRAPSAPPIKPRQRLLLSSFTVGRGLNTCHASMLYRHSTWPWSHRSIKQVHVIKKLSGCEGTLRPKRVVTYWCRMAAKGLLNLVRGYWLVKRNYSCVVLLLHTNFV